MDNIVYAQMCYDHMEKYKRKKSFVLRDVFFPLHEWDFNSDSCAYANLVRNFWVNNRPNNGVYAGKIDNHFVVLLNDGNKLQGCEIYKNLEELKDEWQLSPEYDKDFMELIKDEIDPDIVGFELSKLN